MRRKALAISLYIRGRRILLVGDGPVADRRAARLKDAGADIRRVSATAFRDDMCGDVHLVFAHADDDTNRKVARSARTAGCLTYAHDLPAISDFAMPALARRGPLQLAISTDGTAPALARQLRIELEALLETGGAALDRLLQTLRLQREGAGGGDRQKSELGRIASRLRIRGHIDVASGDIPESAEP